MTRGDDEGLLKLTKPMRVQMVTAGHGDMRPGITLIFYGGEFQEGDIVEVSIEKVG